MDGWIHIITELNVYEMNICDEIKSIDDVSVRTSDNIMVIKYMNI